MANNEVRLSQHPVFWNFMKQTLHSDANINVNSRGMKGGGTFLARSNENPYSDDNSMEDRRSIHVLQLLIENEGLHKLEVGLNVSNREHLQEVRSAIATWKKYDVLCFEALEMEEEAHLVDQVWDTVMDLCAACHSSINHNEHDPILASHSDVIIPSILWVMVGSSFAREFLSDSPTLRKLSLFQFLTWCSVG
jgi:hypothetical protein